MRRNLDLETAVGDVEARFVAANARSKARFDAALGVMPGANTRTTLHFDPFPVTIVAGEGATLTDLDGHRYTDFLGEYTAGLYGHSNPVIAEAVRDALARGTVLGGPNTYEARFAELMCARFPAVERVRFCNSGTEANLMNLCLARAVTQRPKIMVMDGGYHGGVLSFANGGSPINAPFEIVLGRYNRTEPTLEALRAHAGEVAAVILEPMMGAAGCIAARQDFLETLREETARHGILLIFDEVMTSRLAVGGLHERVGVRPDL
ncbi:MAG: aminotransferase class III-fold pyridoxal phosphate-dependent enzyme, partial [Pseudomonadota bacterium]